MEKLRKNKLFILVGIISIILISFVSELIIKDLGVNLNHTKKENIVYTADKLKLNDFDKGENSIISQSEESSFIIKENKKYTEKFAFNFNTNETTKFKIIIKGYNNNNKKIKVEHNLVYLPQVNLVEKKVGFKVEEIKVISYNKNEQISNITIDNTPIFNIVRFFTILLFLLTVFVVICFKKFKFNNIAILYAIVATLIGSCMIIVSPCMAQVSWDEAIHYNNTNSIFRGVSAEQKVADYIISTTGISIPTTYEENKSFHNAVNKGEDHAYEILVGSNIITFSNIIYIPMAFARRVAEIIGFGSAFQFYLGKFISLLLFVFAFAYAIHIAKIGKTPLFVLGLVPLSLFQAISYSRDGLIIAGITLSMVAFINIIIDKKSKVDFKFVALFTLPLLVACLGKANYFPLLLLALFIPKDRFKNNKQKNMFKFLIISITLLVLSTFAVELIFNNSNMGDNRGNGHVNVSEQINVIINNPINYLNIFFKNMLNTFSRLFSNNIGTFAYLGNGSYYLGSIFIILLFISLFTKNEKEDNMVLLGRYKILILFIILVVVFGINLALYLEFTSVGTNYIDGVQPRYYLPILYILFTCLITPKIKNTFNYRNMIFGITLLSTITFYLLIFEVYIWNIYW